MPSPLHPSHVSSEIDLRRIPEEEEQFAALAAEWSSLALNASMALVSERMPLALLHRFFHSHPGAFDWRRVNHEPGRCRVRVTRVASDPSPAPPVAPHPSRLLPQQKNASARVVRRILATLDTLSPNAVLHACIMGNPHPLLNALRHRGIEHTCEVFPNGSRAVAMRRKMSPQHVCFPE